MERAENEKFGISYKCKTKDEPDQFLHENLNKHSRHEYNIVSIRDDGDCAKHNTQMRELTEPLRSWQILVGDKMLVVNSYTDIDAVKQQLMSCQRASLLIKRRMDHSAECE